jgi:hypothetical protein
MRYALNLLDEHGRVLASEPFWAEDDQEAREAGATVLRALPCYRRARMR